VQALIKASSKPELGHARPSGALLECPLLSVADVAPSANHPVLQRGKMPLTTVDALSDV
jgi:hypothetical protein